MGELATSNLTKIFPGSYILFYLISKEILFNQTNLFNRFRFEKKFIWYYLTFINSVIIYFLVDNLSSNISFIIDTLISPFLFFIYLKSSSINFQRYLPLFALKLILVNSFLAIIERIIEFNFFPINQHYGDEFRSTALLGHPLNNALITFIFLLFILIIDMRHGKKIFYLIIFLLALFCFGGRGSLLASFIGIIILYLSQFFISKNEYFSKFSKLNVLVFSSILIAIFNYIFLFTSFGERLRSASKDDGGSANVRLESINLIDISKISNFLMPLSNKSVIKLSENSGVEIIENFLIVWILRFGLILTAILIYFLLRFLFENFIIKNIYYVFIVLSLFFGAALTNNSLASNCNAFIFIVLMFNFKSNKYHSLF
jgi:hypothetical protein